MLPQQVQKNPFRGFSVLVAGPRIARGPEGYAYHYSFHCFSEYALWKFAVWTIPSPFFKSL